MREFEIERKSEDVIVVKVYGMDNGGVQWLMLRGDAHHDSSHSDSKLEIKQLDKAIERDALIIDIGDLFDVMQGKGDPRASYSDLKDEYAVGEYFDKVLDGAVKRYKPYADNFIAFAHGNHETSVIKHYGTNLTKRFVRRLEAKAQYMGYSGYVVFQFMETNFPKRIAASVVYRFFHGMGGNAAVTKGVIHTARLSAWLSNARIIHIGHMHHAWHMPVQKETLNKAYRVASWTQNFVMSPSYKDQGAWAKQKVFAPQPKGCAWAKFTMVRTSKSGRDVDIQISLDIV